MMPPSSRWPWSWTARTLLQTGACTTAPALFTGCATFRGSAPFPDPRQEPSSTLSEQASTWALARPPADQAADRRQLDLFVDGRDALLVHAIVTGLMSRDVDRTEAGLRRLGQEHPRHPDLVALTVLVEALTAPAPAPANLVALTERIELTERGLVQAARRLLGADASTFLRPVWQALAATAADLPFEPAHPRAHRAWLCQQYGECTEVRAAIEDEPCWAETPLLRYWMGLAQHHLGGPEVAI